MTLPLANSPWCLSPDDVFGYRLANARVSRIVDTQQAIGVEHASGETGAGEHNSIQIVRSVRVFRMPKYDATSDFFGVSPGAYGYGIDQELTVYGPDAGWKFPPTLRHGSYSEGGSPETHYFIDCVPSGQLVGLGFCPLWDSTPPFDYDKMHVMFARRAFVESAAASVANGGRATWAGRIFLGNWDAIKNLKGATIVAHVMVEKEA